MPRYFGYAGTCSKCNKDVLYLGHPEYPAGSDKPYLPPPGDVSIALMPCPACGETAVPLDLADPDTHTDTDERMGGPVMLVGKFEP